MPFRRLQRRFVESSLFCLTCFCSLAGAQSQPDLQTTLDFMNRMMQPEGRAVSLLAKCSISVTSDRSIVFIFPAVKGGWTVFGDQSGVEDKFSGYVQLNLADINPDSVGSRRAGFSVGSWKEFANDFPECDKDSSSDHCLSLKTKFFDPEKSDMTMVFFKTTDSRPTVDKGVWVPDKPEANCQLQGGCKVAHSETRSHDGEAGFIFADKDRAQRFVTAFVHAVNLCEGKPDTFAPTHERKP